MRRSGGKATAGILAGLALLATAGGVFAQGPDHQYNAEDVQAGYRLYSANCAACHGSNGDGVAGINLAHRQFHHVVSDDDIRATIANGNAAGMPPFKFQPREVDGLVAFIRSGFDTGDNRFRIGDAVRGKAIYDGKGHCASCHSIDGIGALRAPDLSDIGTMRQPAAIRRSLLTPSQAMLPINRPIRIVLTDGGVVEGRRLNEDTFTVQLMDDKEELLSVAKSDIRSYDIGTTSNMPSFAGTLSDDEIADLLAYLISLKGS